MKVKHLFYCVSASALLLTGCTNYHDNHAMQTQNATQVAMSDSAITAKIKSEMMSQDVFTNKDMASMSIHVKTVHGVVYLTGKATKTQLMNTKKIAKSVDGVKKVVSKVHVVRAHH